jgi:phage terminase small subunit
MEAKKWVTKIKRDTKRAGTYKPFFDEVIKTLASILEERDKAQETFEATGGKVIVAHTNKAGATNLEQNPALRLVNDLNRDALAYWRDLGLTPKGLKAINEQALQEQKADALTEALADLGSLGAGYDEEESEEL